MGVAETWNAGPASTAVSPLLLLEELEELDELLVVVVEPPSTAGVIGSGSVPTQAHAPPNTTAATAQTRQRRPIERPYEVGRRQLNAIGAN